MQELGDLADLSQFREWPLLQVRGRHPMRLAALLPLGQSTLLRACADWPPELIAALSKLGVRRALTSFTHTTHKGQWSLMGFLLTASKAVSNFVA